MRSISRRCTGLQARAASTLPGAWSTLLTRSGQRTADGNVDLGEVTALGVVDGFRRGSVDLALTGQGTGANQYVLDGRAKVINASYAMEYFWIDGVNATTSLHITPDEITLPDLVARPRAGRHRQRRRSLP